MTTQLKFTPSGLDVDGISAIFRTSLERCFSQNLQEIKGKKLIFKSDDRTVIPFEGWGFNAQSNCADIEIRPIIETKNLKIKVSAVDSSSIQLAETEDGAVYAIKCGIAIAFAGHALMHFKIGPILFYLSERSISQSDLDHRLVKLIMLDSSAAKRLIRIRVERAVQILLSNNLTNSIILVDGSLKQSIYESKKEDLKQITENCVMYKNSLVGISKSTKLKVLDRISYPLMRSAGPACMDVTFLIRSLIRNTVGKNTLVRLGRNNSSPVLRADVLSASGEEHDLILGRLIGNDDISSGYPETLQLAHHISTFTTGEISSLKSHLLGNYETIEIASEDIRRTLLGSIPT